MNLENRIKALEKHTDAANKQDRATLIVVIGDPKGAEDIEAFKEAAEAKTEAAKVAYIAEHPEAELGLVVQVISEESKQLTERVLAGMLDDKPS